MSYLNWTILGRTVDSGGKYFVLVLLEEALDFGIVVSLSTFVYDNQLVLLLGRIFLKEKFQIFDRRRFA